MKAIRIIFAIIVTVALFAAEALTMGLFAVHEGLSEESMRKAIDESGVVEEMVDETLAEETVNMGGEYGEMMKAVFESNPVRNFLSAYVSAAVNTQFFGDTYDEIADDELMAAFSDGIDEVNETGAYEISPLEGELLRQALQQKVPDMTDTIDSQVSRFESLDGELSEEAMDSAMGDTLLLSTGGMILAVGVCAALAVLVIALCWRSRLGFLWCSITAALVSLIFRGLSMLLEEFPAQSASDRMISIVAGNGFDAVWLPGLVVAAVMMVLFVIFRITGRKKSYGQV